MLEKDTSEKPKTKKELKQVINLIKQRGVFHTYDFVMNKLEFDSPSPLGYSCAGQVIGVGDEVTNFKVGDYVACGGQGAYHADVVAVYENLAVKVPNIDLKYACFQHLLQLQYKV